MHPENSQSVKPSSWILPIIVFSQFCCTSLWFAGNAVMSNLLSDFSLQSSALGHLTTAVQFGFITGTLVFAVLTIADRFSPSRVFWISALLAALVNAGVIWDHNSLSSLFGLRFFTGFFLAGIYPVGMKIAADYFEKGLGKSLGFLVGALVLGTAFPHLLKGLTVDLPWKAVVLATSGLSVLGGCLMVLLVPNGPFRKAGQQLKLSALFSVFSKRDFRAAAFGYFGHMWELYAFWAFVPIMLGSYASIHPQTEFNIPILSFLIIGIGGLSCVIGGYLAELFGTRRIAAWALSISGICCLLSPIMFSLEWEGLFIGFLLVWGMMVIADSPLFSTLVAHNASPEMKGSALTLVNCIGFAITIVSIQLLSFLQSRVDSNSMYLLLAIGPLFGLISLVQKGSK